MSKFVRPAAFALMVLGASGCYRYIPTTFDAVPPGENVRVYVSRSVMEELQDVVPSNGGAPVLRGKVDRREGDRIFLRVPVGGRQVGFHTASIDQEIPIRLGEVTQVERRQLDGVTTGAMIGAGLGVVAVVIFVIMEAFGEPEFEEECPECADLRIPIFSLPVR